MGTVIVPPEDCTPEPKARAVRDVDELCEANREWWEKFYAERAQRTRVTA